MLQLRPLSAALLAFGLLSHAAIFAAETVATAAATAALKPVASSPAAKPDQPLNALPYHPSLDLSSMDTSVDPCEDFYTYSCGGWKAANPIPSDRSSWSVYSKLAQDNQQYLWGILAGFAKNTEGRNASQQKIGDYFASCMDEASVETRGITPLQPTLDLIAGMKDKASMAKVLAQLHLASADEGLFFGFGASQDLSDSNSVIAFATGGGISLPDRDFYTKTDEKSKKMREQYTQHVAKTFELSGVAAAQAQQFSLTVLAIETELAKATLTQVEKRDPYQQFHKMNLKALQALTPNFNWNAYLEGIGKKELTSFNVTEPKFYKKLSQQWQQRSLAELQTYLRWHVLHNASAQLSSPFVQENFAFYSKTLRGVPEQPPRWKYCVGLIDVQLGEALGQEFVKRNFSPELKDQTLRMTLQIEAALKKDIESLSWMSAKTKAKAQEKLASIVNKIGYPDCWRDYSNFEVKANDFAGNVQRGTVFETRRQLAKIGKPVERAEWGMTPQTVNAYYNPQMNDINFPAGVLQPPLFDNKMDAGPNYGNTGGTIGHEIIHGFDDEGRQFDAKGNLKDWWGKKDAKEFLERSQCIVDQYAGYTIVDDIKINSKLTLGEDSADLGGMLLAWMAWQAEFAEHPSEARDGLSPEQRFFIGFAQWDCANDRPENLRVNALTNPHSPAQFRINGVAVNMPQFHKAFACKAGQAMVKKDQCRVW
ncbi:M13 family metallopeptidase [Undibacterium sp.]|uniref:M13 family metallopeptidase n=1 Tax=Undibacterium sp. TaxID=1914977 RepID=UPI0025FAB6CF|nr:M13 family metallopeptidase [Undibacterium sp.]